MSDHEVDSRAVSRQVSTQPERDELERAVGRAASAREPPTGVTCRLADRSCVNAHASALDRSSTRSVLHLQRQYGNRFVGRVLRQAEGTVVDDPLDAVERSIEQVRGTGSGLDANTRVQMEGAFDADFGDVRVHTDARADQLNRALSARAFATGSDLFFRQGEYNPGASAGRELLAHELTHVVQQTGGLRRKLNVSQPDDPHEVEADEMARAVMQREHAPDLAGGSAPKQEEEDKHKPGELSPSRLQRQAEAPMPEDDKDDKHREGRPVQAKRDSNRAAPNVSRTAETHPLPNWGSSYFNKSSMTLNPFARLTVDGKVLRDDWGLSGTSPAVFKVPKCAKTGDLLISVTGYWFQNNSFGNKSGQGTATVRTGFDVNEKGEVHFKAATANVEAAGESAQMTASGSAADNPPLGGSLVAQVGIVSTDQKGSQAGAGILAFSSSIPTGNSFARGYRADVTVEKKVGVPATKSQSVYYQVGKHQIVGSKDPGQPANIRQIYAFLKGLPKDVRKELEEGSGDKKARIEVLAKASVTTPRNPAAGFNVELTEKRKDSVVRLVQDFLGGGAKVKAKAIGELEATDPGEAGFERVATITVSWEDDPCEAGSTKAP